MHEGGLIWRANPKFEPLVLDVDGNSGETPGNDVGTWPKGDRRGFKAWVVSNVVYKMGGAIIYYKLVNKFDLKKLIAGAP